MNPFGIPVCSAVLRMAGSAPNVISRSKAPVVTTSPLESTVTAFA
jgi:hypothetical protein